MENKSARITIYCPQDLIDRIDRVVKQSVAVISGSEYKIKPNRSNLITAWIEAAVKKIEGNCKLIFLEDKDAEKE